MKKIYKDVKKEIKRAAVHTKKFRSLHEAYGVLLEEVDEMWDITKLKRKNRKEEELRSELIQIAAMAIKAIKSMKNFVGGEL